MKKSKLMGALLCSMCLIAGTAMPAAADSMKVVTLGADLSQEQKNTMLRYFKVNSSQAHIMEITNQDEREHLSAFVPLEQIGTRTVSCAYVKPTQSGGIKVRTANLNWVTGNMIATTLSTSGVKNCEVVAACPFEVSGTGALTGIQMAYETASGEKLDEKKKEIATAEMVVTGNLADEVGKNDATTVINRAKMQVIENGVTDEDEIYDIVVTTAEEYGVSLDSQQIEDIVNLLIQISEQNYDYEDMRTTLERVDENVTGSSELGDIEEEQDDTVEAGDSIMDDLDESLLGDDVLASSTENPELEKETGMETGTVEDMDSDWSEDSDMEEWEEGSDTEGELDYTEEGDYDMEPEAPAEDGLDTSSLDEEQLAFFTKLKSFCRGEYEGDLETLSLVKEETLDAVPVTLGAETAAALSKEVQKLYLDILVNGTDSYVEDGTEMYFTTELNMLEDGLKAIFGLDENAMAVDALYEVSDEDKETLYNDTMKFFEKLYNESTADYEEEDSESYDEEGYYEEDSEMEMEGETEEY